MSSQKLRITQRWQFWAFVIFVIFITWSSLVVRARLESRELSTVSGPVRDIPRPVASIAPGALSTYTPRDYPSTYATWGEDGVRKISQMERMAAEHVAKSVACDRIELVGLSEQRSRPPSEIVVYVDCANRNRFYVGAVELKKQPDDLVFKPT